MSGKRGCRVCDKRFDCEELQEKLDKVFAFALEVDKEKMIGRQTYLSTPVKETNVADAKVKYDPSQESALTYRKENDAEHAWHLALMTILLENYANEPIDVLKTVTMVLIHDIVEIDAGDTYAYDEAGKLDQKEREEKAAQRLYGMLPDKQAKKLYDIWKEFEEGITPEAKFARTMDNLQPMMLNHATGGKAWEEHGVHLSQILKRNKPTPEGSEILWAYAKEHFLAPNVESGKIIKD